MPSSLVCCSLANERRRARGDIHHCVDIPGRSNAAGGGIGDEDSGRASADEDEFIENGCKESDDGFEKRTEPSAFGHTGGESPASRREVQRHVDVMRPEAVQVGEIAALRPFQCSRLDNSGATRCDHALAGQAEFIERRALTARGSSRPSSCHEHVWPDAQNVTRRVIMTAPAPAVRSAWIGSAPTTVKTDPARIATAPAASRPPFTFLSQPRTVAPGQ